MAVIVTHNAGDWLDEALESFAAQTYDNLSVLVIDAASDIDPTPRIARTLPGAFVRRLEHNVGLRTHPQRGARARHRRLVPLPLP